MFQLITALGAIALSLWVVSTWFFIGRSPEMITTVSEDGGTWIVMVVAGVLLLPLSVAAFIVGLVLRSAELLISGYRDAAPATDELTRRGA